MKRFINFITSAVTIFFGTGIILVVIGQTCYLCQFFSSITPASPINTIIKSIGAALIGSGVFTAIIKSAEYSRVFSNVIGEIIWSKKFIEKRSDKKQMWSMISKLIYQEKFPAISEEIENIITSTYFPTDHNYYIEDYNNIINISSHNDDFWEQIEDLTLTIKPTNSKLPIPYTLKSIVDLPFDDTIEDISSIQINHVTVNGESVNLNHKTDKENNFLYNNIEIPLQNSDEYKLELKRTKILCKKSNPDKYFFSKSIIKNASLTLIINVGIHVVFRRMGTITDFTKSMEQVNNDIKVINWTYKGVLLPHQGYALFLK